MKMPETRIFPELSNYGLEAALGAEQPRHQFKLHGVIADFLENTLSIS